MSSPWFQGTKAGTSFAHDQVEILTETLHIALSKNFQEASYTVLYKINVLKDGVQIPIVFVAEDYKNGFELSLDGRNIPTETLPKQFDFSTSDLNDFKHNFTKQEEYAVIQWTHDPQSQSKHSLRDLKYFRTDLSKGEHLIQVQYKASAGVELSNWITEYQFEYSLAPAKHWKQFDQLEITLDMDQSPKEITTNLGSPQTGDLKQKATWIFKEIPVDILMIKLTPDVNFFARFLMWVGPMGIAVLSFLFMFWFHLSALLKTNWQSKWPFRTGLILGTLLATFLFMMVFIFAHAWIDAAIGQHASQRHGYTFFIFFMYPVVALLYGLVVYWIFVLKKS